jgi:hypothetical protein
MTASTVERDTPWQDIDNPINYPVKGNVKILNGTLVMVDSGGFAIPAADTASCHCVGVARMTVDTTAAGPAGLLADGVATIDCVKGVFEFLTSGGSAIVQASLGLTAFILDNQTVVLTAGTVHTVAAGLIVRLEDATHAWIDCRKLGTVIAPT